MVAKSFKNFEIVGSPIEEEDKSYILVRNPSTGNQRKVRWYSPHEYISLYPEDKDYARQYDPYYKPQKDVLGFVNDIIYILKEDIPFDNDTYTLQNYRYTIWWGWYLPGDANPTEDFTPINWGQVAKNEEEIDPIKCANLRRSPATISSTSTFIGSIGERLTLNSLEVIEAKIEKAYRGSSTTHIFKDANDNLYLWKTSAKSWEVGEVKSLRGTVKNHLIINNAEITELTRCVEQNLS